MEPHAFGHSIKNQLLELATVCSKVDVSRRIVIFRPHILKMGEEDHDLRRVFFPNFAKSPQSPPFDYLTILYSY